MPAKHSSPKCDVTGVGRDVTGVQRHSLFLERLVFTRHLLVLDADLFEPHGGLLQRDAALLHLQVFLRQQPLQRVHLDAVLVVALYFNLKPAVTRSLRVVCKKRVNKTDKQHSKHSDHGRFLHVRTCFSALTPDLSLFAPPSHNASLTEKCHRLEFYRSKNTYILQ